MCLLMPEFDSSRVEIFSHAGAALVQRRQDVSDGLVELEIHGLHVLAVPLGSCKIFGPYAFARQGAQFGGEGTQLIIEYPGLRRLQPQYGIGPASSRGGLPL